MSASVSASMPASVPAASVETDLSDVPPQVLEVEALRLAAAQAVAALKVMANEDRLLLLCQLSQAEMSVGELEATLDIHQPTLSQQLGVLRNEGVVNTRREGKRICYSLADPRLLQVLQLLHALYCPKD